MLLLDIIRGWCCWCCVQLLAWTTSSSLQNVFQGNWNKSKTADKHYGKIARENCRRNDGDRDHDVKKSNELTSCLGEIVKYYMISVWLWIFHLYHGMFRVCIHHPTFLTCWFATWIRRMRKNLLLYTAFSLPTSYLTLRFRLVFVFVVVMGWNK